MDNSIEINKQLYTSFMKMNKVARLSFAKRKGYQSWESYKTFLLENINNSGKTKKVIKKVIKSETPLIIHNVDILDVSGSMNGLKLNNTIKGINNQIAELKKDKSNNYINSLVVFGDKVEISQFRTPIKLMPKVNFNTRGLTALYEAIFLTLSKIKNTCKENEKTIVKVFTDGGENASSCEHADGKTSKELIEYLKDKGVTVTFVGTPNDVNSVKRVLNLSKNNTLIHNNTASGVDKAFQINTISTMNYANKVMEGKDVSVDFYKDVN